MKHLLFVSLFILTSCSFFNDNQICVLKNNSSIGVIYKCYENEYSRVECALLVEGDYSFASYGKADSCSQFCDGKIKCSTPNSN